MSIALHCERQQIDMCDALELFQDDEILFGMQAIQRSLIIF